MGGILKVIAFAAPVAAIVLYFALLGTQETRETQQKQQIKMEIRETEFDREWSRAAADVDGREVDPASEAAFDEKIKKLEGELASSEDQAARQMDADLAELRRALNNAEQSDTQGERQ